MYKRWKPEFVLMDVNLPVKEGEVALRVILEFDSEAVLTQHLAARIYENCKRAYNPEQELLSKFFYDYEEVETPVFYESKGCPNCRDAGYRGRIAFHEMALIINQMRSLISTGGTEAELSAAAEKVGCRPLRHDGLKKVLLGFTTVDELEKHTSFDLVG